MAKKQKTSSLSSGSSKMIKCSVTCGEGASPSPRCLNSPVQRALLEKEVVGPSSPKREAALQLQKVYKSFRTRRKLADCAVLAEQQWWKLLDFAVLKRSSISFYDISKQETAISRWSRARTRAAKVGKGLLKDKKARKLALQHWLEAIDPRHRYGHNLHFYYDCWLSCDCRQPFFYWLDVGDGRDCDLYECPRSKLQQQCIKYLGPKEREAYEVIVEDGKFLYKQSRQFLDTSEATKDTKWIFVLSTLKKLYVGQKKKGSFQHSSFLAGGATSAAGRLEVIHGSLQAIWPHSGHYKPTEENFQELIHFLEENNVDLANVENSPIDAEEAALIKQSSCKNNGLKRDSSEPDLVGKGTDLAHTELITEANTPQQQCSIWRKNVTILIPDNSSFLERLKKESEQQDELFSPCSSPIAASQVIKEYMSPTRRLFEEEEQKPLPEESIVHRIISKKGIKCYQLGKQLSFKWTTGAGPRIGCMRDYPMEVQSHVLEEMNLSPKNSGQPRVCSSPKNSSLGHSSRSDRAMVYTSPRCLNPNSLSLPFERSSSFNNSYSIQC